MTDHLSPQAVTWTRPDRAPLSVTDTPAYWTNLAETDARATPALRDAYRSLAAGMTRYLELRGGRP